jgi:hypothetical protein
MPQAEEYQLPREERLSDHGLTVTFYGDDFTVSTDALEVLASLTTSLAGSILRNRTELTSTIIPMTIRGKLWFPETFTLYPNKTVQTSPPNSPAVFMIPDTVAAYCPPTSRRTARANDSMKSGIPNATDYKDDSDPFPMRETGRKDQDAGREKRRGSDQPPAELQAVFLQERVAGAATQKMAGGAQSKLIACKRSGRPKEPAQVGRWARLAF